MKRLGGFNDFGGLLGMTRGVLGLAAPVPVSAFAGGTDLAVTFDRNIAATDGTGWTTDLGNITFAFASGTIVQFTLDLPPFGPGVVSYDGTGDVRGDPDGTPVVAFTNFPVAV